MEKEVEKILLKDIAETREDVKEIKTAVIGNAEFGVEGLVQKVAAHERYIRNDKKLKWLGGGMLLAAGAGLKTALVKLISLIW